jgi:cytochrome c556
MTWNKKNDQYALSCGLRHSSERLLRWLLWRAKRGEVCEIEIDLRVFNQYIAHDRPRPYDRKTLKEALAQLDEKTQGHILITKSYTWAIHKIIIRPIEMVIQQNSQIGDKLPKLVTGNPMFDADHKKQSRELLLQNISKVDSLFQKLGMRYTQDALMRIWRLAGKNMSNLSDAVTYMLQCHAEKLRRTEHLDEPEGVTTPKGWLHDCLKYGWHTVNDVVNLPYLEGDYVYSFVDSLIPSAFECEASYPKRDVGVSPP